MSDRAVSETLFKAALDRITALEQRGGSSGAAINDGIVTGISAYSSRQINNMFNLSQDTCGVLIPAYILNNQAYNYNPNSSDWSAALKLARQHWDIPTLFVLNQTNGQNYSQDNNFSVMCHRIVGAGAKAVWYVTSKQAGTGAQVGQRVLRLESDIKADILKAWQSYGPTGALFGLFIDEMDTADNQTTVDFYTRISDYARSLGFKFIIANPGSDILPRYDTSVFADVIIIAENSVWPTEDLLSGEITGAAGHTEADIRRRAIIVHSQTTLDPAKVKMARQYVGWMYVTSDVPPNPYDIFSPLLPALFNALAPSSAPTLNDFMAALGRLQALDSSSTKRSQNYADWIGKFTDGTLTIDDNTTSGPGIAVYSNMIVLTGLILRSTTPGQPALKIRTAKKIVARQCVFAGNNSTTGGAQGIVLCDWGGVNVDFEDNLFFGFKSGVNGAYGGRALTIPYGFGTLRFNNNGLFSTTGVVAQSNGTAGSSSVEIRYNKIRNLDGRVEDTTTPDGYKHDNTRDVGWMTNQFVQFININAPTFWAVGDNECINYAGKSRYEDFYSYSNVTGTPSVPAYCIEDLIVGHYVYDWAFNEYSNTGFYGNNVTYAPNIGHQNDARGLQDSGGGGLVADGDNGSNTPLQQYCGFVKSTVIAMGNYGLAIQGGSNNLIDQCVILRSGYVYGSVGAAKNLLIPWVHLPIQMQYGPGGTPPANRWSGNAATNNVYGYRNFDPRDSTWKDQGYDTGNGQLFLITPDRVTLSRNIHKTNVSPQDEEDAINNHRARWIMEGKKVGPLT